MVTSGQSILQFAKCCSRWSSCDGMETTGGGPSVDCSRITLLVKVTSFGNTEGNERRFLWIFLTKFRSFCTSSFRGRRVLTNSASISAIKALSCSFATSKTNWAFARLSISGLADWSTVALLESKVWSAANSIKILPELMVVPE